MIENRGFQNSRSNFIHTAFADGCTDGTGWYQSNNRSGPFVCSLCVHNVMMHEGIANEIAQVAFAHRARLLIEHDFRDTNDRVTLGIDDLLPWSDEFHHFWV